MRQGREKYFYFLLNPALLVVLIILIGASAAVIALGRKTQADAAVACKNTPVSSTGFIKTYHVRDNTEGFGIWPTKNGGYVLTGEAVWSGGMQAPYPYVIRMDSKGGNSWTRDFSSASNALGDMSSSHFGRLSVETADGSIVTASDVVDFVDEDKKEIYGDILITKIDVKGSQMWSTMSGDQSIDRPQRLWSLPDGGVMLLARFMQTGFGDDVADTDVVPKYSVLIQMHKNGKVVSVKKFDWDAIDMQRLDDGSYVALANIKVSKTSSSGNTELAMQDLPTIIRLDSNLRVVWAKSLEMIPSELATPTVSGNSLVMGKTTMRIAGGDFRSIQQTPDGGFLAIGYNNLLLTQGLSGSATISKEDTTLRPFVGVKVDAGGYYKWARKLTVNLVSGGVANDFNVTKTTDGQFVIMKGVVRDSQSTDFLTQAASSNIGLIKVDADLNPMWVKKYDVERHVSGYDIKATADKGVVVAGSMLTTKMHNVMGEMVPYTEAVVIKVDANGNAGKCVSVSDHPDAKIQDQSSYLVMQNMSVAGGQDMKLNINKPVKEKVANAKNTVRDICQYSKTNISPSCSYIISIPSTGTNNPPAAKGWALINYEKAKEASISSSKNKMINDELLPILKQVFDQVKMTDSMDGMWLTYYFPRLVTRADVEAVQKKYEALGYKVDDSSGGSLDVSRVGLSLRMTFSITNPMVGKLEVLF